jgi:hypothetical protein
VVRPFAGRATTTEREAADTMTSASFTHQLRPSSGLRSVLLARGRTPAVVSLTLLAAVLVAGSGAVHFYLWDIAYRHVATFGPLFMVQGISAVIVALALVLMRTGYVLVAAAALMLGTLLGFVRVLTTGLFGFKLGFVSGWAELAMAVESAAVGVVAAAGALLWRDTA